MKPRPAASVAAVLTATGMALTGCGSQDPETADGASAPAGAEAGGDAVSVLAAFYPFQFVAERVGGPDVAVENLTKPGAEPHDLELTPQQMGALGEADLVVYLEGFQPAVDEAVEQAAPASVVEVSSVVPLTDTGAAVGDDEPAGEEDMHTGQDEPHAGEADMHAGEDEPHAGEEEPHAGEEDEHAGEDAHGHDLTGDPHVWLDPTKLATVATAVAEALAEADPDAAQAYEQRAAELVAELEDLDEEFAAGLADCERTTFVTSHSAFGYLAARYGLEQVGISGLSPEAEPSPARIAEVQDVVRDEGVTTIFYETLVSPKVAETMAGDLGVDTAVLDPLEGLADPGSGDYFSVMRANLAALQAANGCA